MFVLSFQPCVWMFASTFPSFLRQLKCAGCEFPARRKNALLFHFIFVDFFLFFFCLNVVMTSSLRVCHYETDWNISYFQLNKKCKESCKALNRNVRFKNDKTCVKWTHCSHLWSSVSSGRKAAGCCIWPTQHPLFQDEHRRGGDNVLAHK